MALGQFTAQDFKRLEKQMFKLELSWCGKYAGCFLPPTMLVSEHLSCLQLEQSRPPHPGITQGAEQREQCPGKATVYGPGKALWTGRVLP